MDVTGGSGWRARWLCALAVSHALGLPLARANADLTLDTSLERPVTVFVPGESLRPPVTTGGLMPEAVPDLAGGHQPLGADAGWLSGMASVYSQRLQGRPTASGEPYRTQGWTAAHRDLPLGTWLSVRNPGNGLEVVVRVNDRGPPP